MIIFSGKPEQQITRRTGRDIDALEIASRVTSRRRKRLTIDKGLERVGVSVEDQKKKMVGCNFDGALVMLGSKSGVAQKLKERVSDYLVPILCVAHCLELAILDTVKEVPYLKTFQETVQAVFKY